MDPTLIISAVSAVISLVEGLLPALGVAGSSSATVTNIITVLTKFMPLIEKILPIASDEVSLIYQGIKNIISNLRGVDTDAKQDADLDALDARVDAAWDAVSAGFDPDASPPTG